MSIRKKSIFAFVGCIALLVLANGQISSAAAQDSRTWKDATGKFEVTAKFVKVEGDNVVLEKADGSKLKVPLNKLSPIDQGYVEGRRSTAGSSAQNPFEAMSDVFVA